MASLPGMPGSLGLSADLGTTQQPTGGSDLSLDLPSPLVDFSGGAPIIINKTVLHWLSPFGPDDGHGGQLPTTLTIPPTTEGNTLVIVQNSFWGPDYPRFNGKTAGWADGIDYPDNFTPNDQFSGIFGGSGLPDPPGSPQNVGSLIAYFTNIAGGVSSISYGDTMGQHGAPEWTVVYELTPCVVVDGNPKYVFIDENNFSDTSPFLGVPVDGPIDLPAIYFTGMDAMENSAPGTFFSSVSAPWVIDEQQLYSAAGSPLGGCGAVGIIFSGSGTQQAAWFDGRSDGFASASICLVSTAPTTPTSSSDLDQFLPNVWVVS